MLDLSKKKAVSLQFLLSSTGQDDFSLGDALPEGRQENFDFFLSIIA